MKKNGFFHKSIGAFCALVIVSAIGSHAFALDARHDRRGFFAGLGAGGGVAIQGGEPAGALLFDAQLGGGATRNLTLGLDTDLWVQVFDGYRNVLLAPGPEVNFFFGETGLFARLGIGMALDFTKIKSGPAKGTEFEIGFDGSLGAGFEFFASSNAAVGLAAEADYFVIDGDDIISFDFILSLRFY